MAQYIQGDAPGMLLDKDNLPVWQFVNQKLECSDKGVQAKLEKYGAICLDTVPKVEATEPEGYGGMTKPEVIAHVKAVYGEELSLNQSRPDLMAKVAIVIAEYEAKLQAGAPIVEEGAPE